MLADDRLPTPLDAKYLLYDQFPDPPRLVALRGRENSLASRLVPGSKRCVAEIDLRHFEVREDNVDSVGIRLDPHFVELDAQRLGPDSRPIRVLDDLAPRV